MFAQVFMNVFVTTVFEIPIYEERFDADTRAWNIFAPLQVLK